LCRMLRNGEIGATFVAGARRRRDEPCRLHSRQAADSRQYCFVKGQDLFLGIVFLNR
jgi:hypothetical protein